jgi:ubiquinone/menaquinone biosynthesis C-methylase UbiE
MSEQPGLLFNSVAEQYDRARRDYPTELVDAACEIAGLVAGSHVVEIGCGTGKLTTALAERGLRVEAIDPGPDLVRVAQRNVGTSSVQFHVGRFEDVDLPTGAFDAVFSATAFHWVDPDVGWSKVARLLRPGGVVALLMHIADFEPALLAAWRRVSPEARNWEPPDAQALLSGAEERRNNISELWAWLGQRELGRPEAATLFRDVRLRTAAIEVAETADEVLALTRTQSSYLRLDARRRLELEDLIGETIANLGGTHRPRLVATLATAQRA